MQKPTLLAPAGDWTNLVSAINSGADAIYFGVGLFNMRANAKNFGIDDLEGITEYCREHNVASHMTMNTIIYENELDDLERTLQRVKSAGVDMVIGWDQALIKRCRELEIPLCVSTQASVSNSASAQFYESLGVKRIVLARECSLDDIRSIIKKTHCEIETFVHGAMCVAVSGRCFMSHHLCGKSANRGECQQPCRKEFDILDPETGYKLKVGKNYVLSPKDICTIDILDQLVDAGIQSFKIEGRMRSPEYVAKTVAVYRQAIDLHAEGQLTSAIQASMKEELASVYNRGFSKGFYLNTPGLEEKANCSGNVATTKKIHLGSVLNYYPKANIAYIRLEAGDIALGDTLYLIGETSGVIEITVDSIYKDKVPVDSAQKGDKVTIPCPSKVRLRDQIYQVIDA